MYTLPKVLYNPVGPSRLCIAHEPIARGVRTLMENLMEGNASLPPSMVRDFPGTSQRDSFGGFPAAGVGL